MDSEELLSGDECQEEYFLVVHEFKRSQEWKLKALKIMHLPVRLGVMVCFSYNVLVFDIFSRTYGIFSCFV